MHSVRYNNLVLFEIIPSFIFQQNPSQSVAVKVVTKKGIQKASEILVKEIKILRELTALHHTNLVAMHDCMDSPAYVYVVMEVRTNPSSKQELFEV